MKLKLKRKFEMKDLGKAIRILGIDIWRNRKTGCMFLSQRNYLEKVLDRYGMSQSRPVSTHCQLNLSSARIIHQRRISKKINTS